MSEQNSESPPEEPTPTPAPPPPPEPIKVDTVVYDIIERGDQPGGSETTDSTPSEQK